VVSWDICSESLREQGSCGMDSKLNAIKKLRLSQEGNEYKCTSFAGHTCLLVVQYRCSIFIVCFVFFLPLHLCFVKRSVSAVTVAPTYRRLGLAKTLMKDLEDTSTDVYNAYFVDLFVRASNQLAVQMYEKFGYVTYRRVLGYYSGEDPEDAFDMRKALPRDSKKESVIPLDRPIRPEELEW
jgi:GNAT superfamily N-acetyltransferase